MLTEAFYRAAGACEKDSFQSEVEVVIPTDTSQVRAAACSSNGTECWYLFEQSAQPRWNRVMERTAHGGNAAN